MNEYSKRAACSSGGEQLSRREMLAGLWRIGMGCPLAVAAFSSLPNLACRFPSLAVTDQNEQKLSATDEQFLDEMERANFFFFWDQANPYNGLIKDNSQARVPGRGDIASIAATGFGLTAICIADYRGYIKSSEARKRVLATLKFLRKRLLHEHGFFYHFVEMRTGERAGRAEVSSIDTAILLCGVMTCRHHFEDREIRQLATEIYNRVDWPWLLTDGTTLCHGWKPEGGFLKARWDTYSELMMLYLLGLGSPTHPLPEETWEAWKRPVFDYEGIRYIGSNAPLFVHQYSHAWFDFRGKRDRHADYFQNSVLATEAHRQFCLSLREQFPKFSEDLWGITASDSPHGYVVWGGPPPMGPLDGTLVPSAPGGSLPFLPQQTLRVLRTIRQQFGKRAWKRYGFVDAFNPHTGWFSPMVIGINTGITLLMAENARSQFVWNTFMKNDEVKQGMDRAGFKPYAQMQPEAKK